MLALTRRHALLATLSLVACSRAFVARASLPPTSTYHRWHIDLSRVPEQQRETVMAGVRKQLDAIEIRGIAQDIVEFMRSVPLRADTSLSDNVSAQYDRAKGIAFRPGALDPKKPVLLHELLRAFHDQKLGYGDQTIIDAYKQSRASGAWPAKAPMLKSAQDFFAATATVYLHGAIDTEPFTPGRLRELQPQYWMWLGEVFDGFRGCD